MEDWVKRDKDIIWHPFTPLGDESVMIESASGVYLNTNDGRSIIDAVSSWWVNIHGHSHPAIAEAIYSQARELEHVIFAGFTHKQAITICERLAPHLPLNSPRMFFSDDGSTSVEVGLKVAMQHWYHLGAERPLVVALDGAYHGDTFGAMSVGERGLFTRPWQPYLFDVSFIPFPFAGKEHETFTQFENLLKSGKVGVFIFEPLIQAAAGMRMYAPEVLDRLLSMAADYGVITLADEVFTGFGRTGKLFACDHLTHRPDIMSLSKGLTGGTLPLGLTACAEKVLESFKTTDLNHVFFHGHSFTGNPLSCAAANASLTLTLDPSCAAARERIHESHMRFKNQVAGHQGVAEVRCFGTVIAIQLKSDEATGYANAIRKSIYPYFMKRNILLRPLGNVLYMVPPYVITNEELETVYRAIEEFLDEKFRD